VDAVSEHYWVLHGLMAVKWDGNGRGAVRRSVVQAARFKLRCSFNVQRAKTSQSRRWDRERTEASWRCGDEKRVV
jgi:hypothetical protein